MRVLALDIGKVRTGIAVSDPQGRLASPVCVLATSDVQTNAPSWKRVLEDWEPDMLLAGLPFSLNGGETAQTKQARTIAEALAQTCGLPLHFTDERLSSVEAKRSLHEMGETEMSMRGKVDMIAASIFLQAWLDERAATQAMKANQADTDSNDVLN